MYQSEYFSVILSLQVLQCLKGNICETKYSIVA